MNKTKRDKLQVLCSKTNAHCQYIKRLSSLSSGHILFFHYKYLFIPYIPSSLIHSFISFQIYTNLMSISNQFQPFHPFIHSIIIISIGHKNKLIIFSFFLQFHWLIDSFFCYIDIHLDIIIMIIIIKQLSLWFDLILIFFCSV